MRFFHRYDQDGVCEVICTKCFLTVGSARELIAIKDMEARHACGRIEPRYRNASKLCTITPRSPFSEKTKVFNACALFAAIILSLYLFPTLIEIGAARIFNPWLAIILPGDIAGCVVLMTVFRMRWVGALLYLILTFFEGCLYEFRVVAPGTLLWITDIVPALLAAGLMMRSQLSRTMRLRTSL